MIMLAVYLKNVMMLLAVYIEKTIVGSHCLVDPLLAHDHANSVKQKQELLLC